MLRDKPKDCKNTLKNAWIVNPYFVLENLTHQAPKQYKCFFDLTSDSDINAKLESNP